MNEIKPIISLCIPTNGIGEWVFPVLDSIYCQGIPEEEFEVILTDNGKDDEFYSKALEYSSKHSNLLYSRNDSYMFYNQIEALKLAKGVYLKFINHRCPLVDGALKQLITSIQDNMDSMATLYFSNGVLGCEAIECSGFDEFVFNLRRYASWTTGVGIWKSEFEKIKENLVVDKISPHSCILFSNRHSKTYKIYDYVFCSELTNDHSKKGTYDLFKAFGVEELAITQRLYIDGDITADTLKKVKQDYGMFLSENYWDFCVRKKPCSYNLNGFDDAMGIYFNKLNIVVGAYRYGINRLIKKILKMGK